MPRDRPRVLHLFNTLGAGGMERQILQLVRLLRDDGRFEVFVAAQAAEGPLLRELEALGIGPVPAYPLRRLHDLHAVRQARRFAAHLGRLRIDLLHTHDFYTTTFGMAAGVLARVPARVAARRELDVFSRSQRAVERLAYRAAHAVVANCERLREQLLREGVPASRALTIANAVDPARVAVPPRSSRRDLAGTLGLPATHRFVTLVAHLYNRKKDPETFLRAAGRVIRAHPDAAFVIAGGGDPGTMRSLRARAEVQLGPGRLFLTGATERVAELLALSEVCVLSSRSEGSSNSVLEYMAAGRPVVATEVGGTVELVVEGETGHLVPPGDDVRMAGCITTLLANPGEARRMGARGRDRVLHEFSLERLREATVSLYERLLSLRSP